MDESERHPPAPRVLAEGRDGVQRGARAEQQEVLGVPPLDALVLPYALAQAVDDLVAVPGEALGPVGGPLLVEVPVSALPRNGGGEGDEGRGGGEQGDERVGARG